MRFFTASHLGNDSKIYTIKRCDGCWTYNFPSTRTLNKGEFLITDVNFCDGTWSVTPKLPKDSLVHLLVTPHFEIKADDDAKKAAAWTGHIEGVPKPIAICKGGVVQLNKAIADEP